jgi:hypothetical protein
MSFDSPNTKLVLLAILALAVGMPSCRSLPPQSQEALALHDTLPWTRDQLEGLSISLIDPKKVEQLTFYQDGTLTVTAGPVGGMLVSPLCGWRLIRGRLFMTDTEGEIYGNGDEFYLVSMAPDILTLRRSNGDIAHYKVTKRHEQDN